MQWAVIYFFPYNLNSNKKELKKTLVPTLCILNVVTVPTLCILNIGTFSSSHHYMQILTLHILIKRFIWPKFLGPKTFLDPQFVWTYIFLELRIFLGPKFFWTQYIFGPKFGLDPKIFYDTINTTWVFIIMCTYSHLCVCICVLWCF